MAPGFDSGPLRGKGVPELLAQGGRTMRLEVDVCFVYPKMLCEQLQSLHRWAGNAGLQVVNVLLGGAQHIGQLHRGLAAFLS